MSNYTEDNLFDSKSKDVQNCIVEALTLTH
jgi:hypothetical protein